MAGRIARISLLDLDTRSLDFSHQWHHWAKQTRDDVAELVEGTKKTMAESRDLMAEIDRLLTRR
jgi:hypothetical protein